MASIFSAAQNRGGIRTGQEWCWQADGSEVGQSTTLPRGLHVLPQQEVVLFEHSVPNFSIFLPIAMHKQ